ncbi:MAG: hypothetical protein HFJ28_06220 [Clostridia bacterium]|nr:hypothetical protein [Clostridia bacterium]
MQVVVGALAVVICEKAYFHACEFQFKRFFPNTSIISNKDIDKNSSIKNYSLKSVNTSYQKEFTIIKEKYNLKDQIKKVSNVMCKFIITSDKEFFETIGEKETKRYFRKAYEFVASYQNLGEEFKSLVNLFFHKIYHKER